MIHTAADSSFKLTMKCFDYATGLRITSKKFDALFGAPLRKLETKLTQRDMNLAESIQKITEDTVVYLANAIALATGAKNLCLAGSVALNCVANEFLCERIYSKIYGSNRRPEMLVRALGVALSVWHLECRNERKPEVNRDAMKGAYLEPKFEDSKIEAAPLRCGAKFKKIRRARFN